METWMNNKHGEYNHIYNFLRVPCKMGFITYEQWIDMLQATMNRIENI